MLTPELLEEFKRLYQKKYNVCLSDEENTRLATDFLNLMKVLLRPKPKKVESNQSYQSANQI
jgi:hypothetical protein